MAVPPGAPTASGPDHPGVSAAVATEGSSAGPHGRNDVPQAWTPDWPGEGTSTGLASLLFLVNFVAWLDENENENENTVMPAGWALVNLLGRYLLGDQLSDFAGDPIWDMLAGLDGRRRGTLPAVGLGATDPLRLPQAWLRRWSPPDSRYIACRNGPRLVVRHRDAGFVAADVPCAPRCADEVCTAEAELLGGAEIIMEDQADDAAPTAEQRFGAVVGAYVRWLLHSKGIGVPSLTSPGRVQVTSTHIDVLLSLEDVDLPARVAGLDHDPGWLPVLGRIVLFHFLAAL